jgi:hypothetical protein
MHVLHEGVPIDVGRGRTAGDELKQIGEHPGRWRSIGRGE